MALVLLRQERRSPKERAAELINRFDYADNFRKQYERRAIENYKVYVGYRPPLPEDAQGRSNLHIPLAYEMVDTLRSRIHQAFVRTRPYVDFVPIPSAQQLSWWTNPAYVEFAEQQAKLAAALVDTQLEKNDWEAVFYDYLTSLLIFPAAILAVGWRYEQKRVRRRVPVTTGLQWDSFGNIIPRIEMQVIEQLETAWDDNEIINVDFFDFWIDPKATNIDNARFVYQREIVTRGQIEDLMVTLSESQSGDVFQLDWEALKDKGAEWAHEGRFERLSEVGVSISSDDGDWPEGVRRGELFELLHYWEDDRHAILVNRDQLLFDGMNPYWRHSKKPFVFQSWEPLPNEPYGLSAMDIIRHLNEELNTNRNQRIDNVSLVLNRMWLVRKNADIDESELVSRPHGIVRVDDIHNDIRELSMSDVTASTYNDEAIIRRDAENALGTPALVRGATDASRQTATEATIKNASAGIRFDTKIVLFDTLGLKRMAELMDLNNQQFVTTPRAVKLFSHDEVMSWKLVQPNEIIGEHEYRPGSSAVDPATNKEVRRAQLTQALEVILKTQIPFVDLYELVKAWLETFDIRSPERILIPREVFEQQQLLAQLAQGGPAALGQALALGQLAPQAPAQAPPLSMNPIQQLLGARGIAS